MAARNSDEESDPFFSREDSFTESGGNSESRDPFKSHNSHTRLCKHKRCDSIQEILSEVIAANAAVLSAGKRSFARRPLMNLCYATSRRYYIVLSLSTVKCSGCKRDIRSSRHACRVYDLFDRDQPLGRHLYPIYLDIDRNNFLALAKHLPYSLPDHVLNDCLQLVPACQSVEFLDKY